MRDSLFPSFLLVLVLDKVRSFLPQLEAANVDLQEKITAGDNVDLESVQDDERYIEMVRFCLYLINFD